MNPSTTDILHDGVKEIIDPTSIEKKLQSNQPLNIKLGVDPTSSDLHLGHAVVLRKMRQFQQLGHQVYLVIGDFTASIGDPAGVNVTRPVLSDQEIRQNMASYLEQAGLILDIEKTHVVYNSEWLKPMSLTDFSRYAMYITLATLTEREDFARRLKEHQPLALHELFYPVVQAIDSVQLKADIEIGGWDQRLNLLMGRELQKKLQQNPQDIILMKPLLGLDGERKMSSSYHNYIGLTEKPNQMFGKIMSLPDSQIAPYAELAAEMNESELKELNQLHPLTAKEKVAEGVVGLYHGVEAAKKAQADFDQTFRRKQVAEEVIESVTLNRSQLTLAQLVSELTGQSTAASIRLIEQGGVRVDGKSMNNPRQEIQIIEDSQLIQIGKRRFYRVNI